MAIKRVFISTQISKQTKAEFLATMKDEFNGASDFFRKRINEKCNVKRQTPLERVGIKGFIALNVSVSPEQRAALLAQCEKEGKTMGTWMREQILEYLKSKGAKENE